MRWCCFAYFWEICFRGEVWMLHLGVVNYRYPWRCNSVPQPMPLMLASVVNKNMNASLYFFFFWYSCEQNVFKTFSVRNSLDDNLSGLGRTVVSSFFFLVFVWLLEYSFRMNCVLVEVLMEGNVVVSLFDYELFYGFICKWAWGLWRL